MSVEQQVRDLLGPADPARSAAVAAPVRPARSYMTEIADRSWRPSRRLVLAAGVLTVASGAVLAVRRRSPESSTQDGAVLVPIAYQQTDAPPAADRLRELADRLTDAAYEHQTGRYAYHDVRIWGDPVLTAPDGRHHVAYAERVRSWETTDGSGRQITSDIVAEYPDAASRAYWAHRLPAPPFREDDFPLPSTGQVPLPSRRSDLTAFLAVDQGPGAIVKQLSVIYGRYAVPKTIRAEILRIIADAGGFAWRGTVTDRGGRTGVAITADDRVHDQQHLVVLHPGTGQVLALEMNTAFPPVRVGAYQLILDTRRTETTD
jgi:hypothetical protein